MMSTPLVIINNMSHVLSLHDDRKTMLSTPLVIINNMSQLRTSCALRHDIFFTPKNRARLSSYTYNTNGKESRGLGFPLFCLLHLYYMFVWALIVETHWTTVCPHTTTTYVQTVMENNFVGPMLIRGFPFNLTTNRTTVKIDRSTS